VTSPTPACAVVGAGGLARDLVEHVLVNAGFTSTDPAQAEVAVILDPDAGSVQDARESDARVVVITSDDMAPERLASLVLQGADAVLDTTATAADIEEAVQTVAGGGSVLPPDQLRAVLDAVRAEPRREPNPLTTRELEILRCINEGASVKQTALTLGITAKTVENLQSRLFRKLGVRNRAQAMSHAHAQGLLST